MAPHNISLANQLQELNDKKSQLENRIEINKDLQDFSDEQINKNCWHLSNMPLRKELLHPDTVEYKELQKEETRLRKSCRESRKNIEELKEEILNLNVKWIK